MAMTITPRKTILQNARSYCALGIVALFVLFLRSSQPHRVHHLIDSVSGFSGESDHQHHNDDRAHASITEYSSADREQATDHNHFAAPLQSTTTHRELIRKAANPLRSLLIAGFNVSKSEVPDLIEFLNSLTDESFGKNPNFSDPWRE